MHPEIPIPRAKDQTNFLEWVTLALVVSLFFSPPLVNLFELLLVTLVLASSDCRSRLLKSIQSSIGLFSICFFGLVVVGALYSIAPKQEAWNMVIGWRKIIVLFFACAAVQTSRHKQLLVKTFIATVVITMICSYLSFYFPTGFESKGVPGIIVKNHATQGMFFAVGSLLAAVYLRYFQTSTFQKIFLYCLIIAVLINLTNITIGRSGYVVALTAFSVFAFMALRINLVARMSFTAIVLVSTAALFLVTTVSGERISLAVKEFTNASQLTTGDPGSMGVRFIWWRHSIDMVKEHPLIGIGTGGFERGLDKQVQGLTGPTAIRTNDPHNQYLKILVEHGTVGLLIFFGILISPFFIRNLGEPYKVAGLAVMISWAATSLANSHFSTFHEGHFIWFWLGAMLSPEK